MILSISISRDATNCEIGSNIVKNVRNVKNVKNVKNVMNVTNVKNVRNDRNDRNDRNVKNDRNVSNDCNDCNDCNDRNEACAHSAECAHAVILAPSSDRAVERIHLLCYNRPSLLHYDAIAEGHTCCGTAEQVGIGCAMVG